MIGDSLTSDIQGAQAAGMKTIWVNREGLPNNNSIIPDFEVTTLSELKNILP